MDRSLPHFTPNLFPSIFENDILYVLFECKRGVAALSWSHSVDLISHNSKQAPEQLWAGLGTLLENGIPHVLLSVSEA